MASGKGPAPFSLLAPLFPFASRRKSCLSARKQLVTITYGDKSQTLGLLGFP
jgi:hypothetical protein